jgi:hypothetical protein
MAGIPQKALKVSFEAIFRVPKELKKMTRSQLPKA